VCGGNNAYPYFNVYYREGLLGMKSILIRDYRNGAVIFSGCYSDLGTALAAAVAAGHDLAYADLSRANLVNAALDEAQLRGARLCGANLTGANMSEGCYDGADFSNACLHGACLAGASLRDCNFDGALFGATDIAAARLGGCQFSTLSAFGLNFADTAQLEACTFIDPAGQHCPFSRPPLLLHGLPVPVVLMDEHLKIGSHVKTYRDWCGETALPLFAGNLLTTLARQTCTSDASVVIS